MPRKIHRRTTLAELLHSIHAITLLYLFTTITMSLSKFCRGNVGRLLSADCLEAEVSARMYFVSFLGSRIHDPQEFLETFQATVEPSPCKIFGGKEKRTDATSHYHVLIVSEQALTLTNGIGGLRMWYNFDFQNEVDTYDIEIRVKRDEQYISSFPTCFGDQSLSPFPAGAESSMEREAEVDLGLFQIGDDAPAMTTPIYPGTKSIPAFLGLNDCPPPCTFPCGCIGVYLGIETRSVASTHNRAREDEDHRAWYMLSSRRVCDDVMDKGWL
ncbi:uncharacterized protein FOBCDRAFT_289355, partial [Fusarium oxysporum Fo47]|uniref:uncharacterized protein n=1 Tax=Fusarium oxysporum Fo47 TaxID=660027 RepID=UPI002869A4F8